MQHYDVQLWSCYLLTEASSLQLWLLMRQDCFGIASVACMNELRRMNLECISWVAYFR